MTFHDLPRPSIAIRSLCIAVHGLTSAMITRRLQDYAAASSPSRDSKADSSGSGSGGGGGARLGLSADWEVPLVEGGAALEALNEALRSEEEQDSDVYFVLKAAPAKGSRPLSARRAKGGKGEGEMGEMEVGMAMNTTCHVAWPPHPNPLDATWHALLALLTPLPRCHVSGWHGSRESRGHLEAPRRAHPPAPPPEAPELRGACRMAHGIRPLSRSPRLVRCLPTSALPLHLPCSAPVFAPSRHRAKRAVEEEAPFGMAFKQLGLYPAAAQRHAKVLSARRCVISPCLPSA